MNQQRLFITCLFYLSSFTIFSSHALAENSSHSTESTKTTLKPTIKPTIVLAQQQFEQAKGLIKQKKIAEAIHLIKKAADSNHPQALFELASYYELGLGVSKDYSLAIKYYKQAIKAGASAANFNLALLLINPEITNNNLAKARTLMKVLAERGDIEAQYSLALMYKDEMGNTHSDFTQSIDWLRLAANAGHTDAEFNLGLHYLKGEQVVKNVTEAYVWFNKAAKKGMPRAQFNLALMYEKGMGTSVDHYRSLKWYKSSAALGNANAQQNLGIKYLLGKDVEQDDSKAISLITHAAKQQHINAQYLLARLYQTGRNTIQADILKAETWYLLSAKQGHSEAQYQLALILSEKKDGQQAAKFWAYQAAFAGHKNAYLLQAKL